MKRIVAALFAGMLVFSFCAMIPASADAQALKMGFVKDERFKTEFKGWKAAQEELETQMKAWEDEVTTKRTELQTMSDEYDKQRLILSDEKKKEREAQMQTKYDALDSFTKSVFGPGGLAESKHKMLIEPLLEKISKAIEAVAIRDGYDVIFTLASIGYIKDSYDVTDKVLAYLEENE